MIAYLIDTATGLGLHYATWNIRKSRIIFGSVRQGSRVKRKTGNVYSRVQVNVIYRNQY